jgi:hypothetical protein
MIRPIENGGFADREIIRPLIRRVAIRTATTEARDSVEALRDLLNEHREPLACNDAALIGESLGLSAGDQQGSLGRAAINLRKGDALREEQLLQGIDLITQLLDQIEIGVRHGLFSCASDEEANRAGSAAHRLSGVAK